MSELDDKVVEFMLTELQMMESELHRTHQAGPARLNFLLSLVSAVYGGIITLSALGKIPVDTVLIITLIASLILFIVSLSTYEFMIFRSVSLDRNARGTGRIRRYFIDHVPEIDQYITWQKDDQPTHWILASKSTIRNLVLVLSSCIAGLSSGLAVYMWWSSLLCSSLVGILVTILLSIALYFWTKIRLLKAIRQAKHDIRFVKAE